ncbi:MAG TPA: lysylphosphatidylglycerol synthase domain-containing protein [Polyangiales bacterium]|jgi:hypothetical protein
MKLNALRVLLLTLMAALVALFMSRVDWPTTLHYLRTMGPRAPLVLVPYVFVVACDTLGWRASFETPHHLSLPKLWCIRIATDALSNSLPAGPAVGETLKALLLRRMFGIAITEGTANVVVSKFSLAIAQGFFLIVGVTLSSRELADHSRRLIGRAGLEWFGVIAAVAFLSLLVTAALLAQRSMLSRALVRLRNRVGDSWQRRLGGWEAPFARVDHGLAVIARVPRLQALRSVAFFLLGWMLLGLENWVILSLLHSGVSVANAISMEAVVSIVRILFFFVPSAFGAQEVSYYALFKVYGVPEAENVAAAFMLTKRAKEACFIALGYLVLSLLPARVAEVRSAVQ